MTANEKRLLGVFVFLCITLFLGISFFLRYETLSAIHDSIANHEKAIAETKSSPERLGELQERVRDLEKTSNTAGVHTDENRDLPSSLARLRKSLEAEGIRPDRYTISGKEPSQSIEFSLRSRPLPFFRFLEKQSNNGTGSLFTYVHMRYIRNSPDYDIVFRVKHEK